MKAMQKGTPIWSFLRIFRITVTRCTPASNFSKHVDLNLVNRYPRADTKFFSNPFVCIRQQKTLFVSHSLSSNMSLNVHFKRQASAIARSPQDKLSERPKLIDISSGDEQRGHRGLLPSLQTIPNSIYRSHQRNLVGQLCRHCKCRLIFSSRQE